MRKNSKHKTKTDDVNVNKEIFIKGQIYKDVFSKKDLWTDLAELYDGEFKIKQTISKDINSFRLEIPYKNHNIILTETDTKPLKFETELKLNRKFEFNISWEDSIERVLKIFGKQDIKVGDKEFDKKYLIQSNEPGLITNILNYREISRILLKHNIYLLTLEYNKKDEGHKLMTIKDRNTKKKEIMIELINLEFSIIDFFIDNNLIRN
ncbi:MAG: hypothetical protein DRJ15_09090 [Bacteroidetes bacterium]|nr:MAG: hypothetical protein DRJ15_09090 [Bacteroidota bacterium]